MSMAVVEGRALLHVNEHSVITSCIQITTLGNSCSKSQVLSRNISENAMLI